MATVPELKAKIAAIDAQLIPLKAAAQAAKIKTDQAQAALDTYYNTPGHISLSAKINAQNAVKADPNNVQLQQNLATINVQWSKQSAELAPLLAARDAAFEAQIQANAPVVALDAEAAQYELDIAKIDPTQASPEALAYLRETSGVPITPLSDPGLQSPAATGPSAIENATVPATGQNAAADAASLEANASKQQVIDPNSDPNTNIGIAGQLPSAQKTLPDSSPTGPARDDNGNLMPGWNEDEFGTPYYVGGNFVAPTTQASANATTQGITANLANTQGNATNQDAVSFEKAKDWRVRLSLAPNANYLYKAEKGKIGILAPLAATNGVIFPYTPSVSVVYAASYDASELVHSNYKIYNYKNSAVDTVTITGDFTAQDTNEANYLLAVIHFFKSVTKMFYGQDQNPRNGTPPPLVYMSGLGTFQFDNHPLVVSNFTYSLPNEVDYIRSGSVTTEPGSSTTGQITVNNTDSASNARIQSSGLGAKIPNFQRQQATINSNATYVPTKMQIVITCIPIVTRNDISNNFSLRDYATGALLQGSKRNGGGIW
jgi:hypothetical protein